MILPTMVSSFLLLRPHYFLLLIPLALVGLITYLKPRQHNAWVEIIDKQLLDFLIPFTQSGHKKRLLLMILLTWVITVLALIGPSFSQSLLPQQKQLTPRIILLDLSSNMQKKDLLPNRLERAKFKIQDFLELAKESETSLIVFTEEPFLVTPFTEDKQTINNLTLRLQPKLMPIDGQNIQKALQYAENLFDKNNMRSGEILLMTSSIPNQLDFDAAAALKAKGFHTSVLGIGETNELPNKTYRILARAGGGIYLPHKVNNSDLKAILNLSANTVSIEKRQSGYQPHDDGYYLVFIVMLLVLLGFRKGLFEQLIRA